MPIIMNLTEGIQFILKGDAHEMEVISKGMGKRRLYIGELITGKRIVIRAELINFIREITDAEIEEGKKRMEAENERQGRIVRAVPGIPGRGFHN